MYLHRHRHRPGLGARAPGRADRARHLLETTDLPVDQVARHAGFGTAAALRAQMAAAVGVAPSAYRNTFRSAG